MNERDKRIEKLLEKAQEFCLGSWVTEALELLRKPVAGWTEAPCANDWVKCGDLEIMASISKEGEADTVEYPVVDLADCKNVKTWDGHWTLNDVVGVMIEGRTFVGWRFEGRRHLCNSPLMYDPDGSLWSSGPGKPTYAVAAVFQRLEGEE